MYGIVDYYSVLKISPDASPEEVKKSFRRLAHLYHPDKVGSNPDSQVIFRFILEAYTILSSEDSRQRYNDYLRTSSVIKGRKEKNQPDSYENAKTSVEKIVSNLKSQLNYILWEIEDLLKVEDNLNPDRSLGGRTVEEIIVYMLVFFDKWVLNTAGFGDYFYTARQINIKEEFNPFRNDANRSHRPYVDTNDYFFHVRRRFDKFLNKFSAGDLSAAVPGAGVSLYDCIFEAVNLSFHYLGLINSMLGNENINYRPYIFSKGIFDEKELKYL